MLGEVFAVKESAWVTLTGVVALSVTFTVKLEVALAVAVPESTPAALSVRPVGNVPEARDHVSVPVPPLAFSVAL